MTDPRTILHQDCRHVRWDRPCSFHKREGALCPTCPHHDPIRRRVLLVKLAADGDVLRTTGLLPLLRREEPATQLTWVTAPSAAPLLEGNPLIDRILAASAGPPPELLAERFDEVLCPDADPRACALAALSRAPRRRGFTLLETGAVRPLSPGAERWFRMGLNDDLKRAGRQGYAEILSQVLELPAPAGPPVLVLSRAEKEAAQAFRRGAGIDPSRPLVGCNTGAGSRWPLKAWRPEGFLALGRLLVQRGCSILLLGGPLEEERNRRLAAEGGAHFHDAGSRNPVRAFAARLGLCNLLVTGDTLALHIGVALGVPMIATFGPTSAAEIDLFGAGEKLLPPDPGCLCCYDGACDRSPTCQDLISVEQVLAAVERWLP